MALSCHTFPRYAALLKLLGSSQNLSFGGFLETSLHSHDGSVDSWTEPMWSIAKKLGGKTARSAG